MTKGSNFHPARISQQQKMAAKRAYDKMVEDKSKTKLKPLDTSKGDWSTNKT